MCVCVVFLFFSVFLLLSCSLSHSFSSVNSFSKCFMVHSTKKEMNKKKILKIIEIETEPQSAVPEAGWFGKNEHYIASNFRNCLVKINEIEPIERINASNSTMFQQLHPQCNSRALNYFTQTLFNIITTITENVEKFCCFTPSQVVRIVVLGFSWVHFGYRICKLKTLLVSIMG